MTEQLYFGWLFFIFGSIVGSFLNVCIVRMPDEKSVVAPRSHCTKCKKTIAWYDNIPYISYIILGGKCRYCKEKFSFLYFFIELLTGLTFVAFYLYYGLDIVVVPYLFMACCFIVATFVDFGHRIIPDEISIGGLVFGLVFSFFIPVMHEMNMHALYYGRILMYILVATIMLIYMVQRFLPQNAKEDIVEEDHEEQTAADQFYNLFFNFLIISAIVFDVIIYLLDRAGVSLSAGLIGLDAGVVGFMTGGALIYLMGMLGDFLFKKESMGGGDVKLLAMIGAFLGWKAAVLTFFIAPVFGAAFGIIEKIRTKDTVIAYGPFLVLGALLCLFKGAEIWAWIMSGYGMY